MESVEIIAEVLKYAVPGALILFAVKLMADAQLKRQQLESIKKNALELYKQHLPLKLNAYERAILFLERISPENIFVRVSSAGKTAAQYHRELVQEIRNEFEHNLTQQLYISNQGWQALVNAKEEILGSINQASRELKPEDEALALSKRVIQQMTKSGQSPSHKATFVLKADINRMFSINPKSD